MDTESLFFPQNNDVVVTARFPEISDGTGLSSQFWYKTDRKTPDADSSSLMFSSSVIPDPDNAGSTMSKFNIPSIDNQFPGSFWWRVDLLDATNKRRTANCGTLLVEAV